MNDFFEASRYCPFDIESKTQVKITKIHNTEYSFPSQHKSLLRERYTIYKDHLFSKKNKIRNYDKLIGYLKFFEQLSTDNLGMI
jgi:hypothetical protein